MLPKTHTEFKLEIFPVGEESYTKIILFKDKLLNSIDIIDEYISWGNEGNYIIKEAIDISKYYMLDNYKVLEFINLSDSDLGIRWALENSNRVEKIRKNKILKDNKDFTGNGWIKPNGEFIKIDGFHDDYAENYIYDNNLRKEYRRLFDNEFGGISYSDFLEDIGWVRIQGEHYTKRIKYAYFKKITYAQQKTLLTICIKYNKNMDDVIYHSEWLWNLEKNKIN